VQEVYNFVLKELEESIPYLEEVTLHRQRIYRLAGYAILGRTHLVMCNYEKATEAFAQAHTLLSNSTVTLDFFNYRVEMPVWLTNPNFIGGLGYPINFAAANVEIILNRHVSSSIAGFSFFNNPRVFVKPEYMALFVEGDLRRHLYTTRDGTFSNHVRSARGSHNEGVDLPALYLMYAECLARTGNLTKARELITRLRENRFETDEQAAIPANVNSREELIVFIVEERLREYMKTGHRWFDMRRLWNDPLFQHLKASYTHTDGENTWTLTEERLVFRMPPSTMVFHPNWTDNP
jgi:tetratricopeptide (TPR) repeat protein